MSDQAPTQQDEGKPADSSPASQTIKEITPLTAKPTAAEQLKAVEKELTGFEKATIRWARTAVVMSGLAAIFVCLQWWEMHTGSVDTHNLAVNAGKQVDRMQSFADRMKDQSDRTKDLADRMKEQADHTKNLAEQATLQANAAKRSADAAILSIRPWLKITAVDLRDGIGDIDTLMFHWPQSGLHAFPNLAGKELPPTLQLKVALSNVGHSPAKDVEVAPELFFHHFDSGKWHEDIIEEEQRFCSLIANGKRSPAQNKIVFPSDPLDLYMGANGIIPTSAIIMDHDARYTSAALIVCVNYRGSEESSYQTQAWYGLYEDNRIAIPVGVDVPASRLRLTREASGDTTK